MRLICPNCDARYEVPDTVMPPEGRDVQCSNCGQMWFQEHPAHPQDDPETGVDAEITPTETPTAEPQEAEPEIPARRALDPAVADVLRAEAELEARARRRESGPIESQPELGLTEGDSTAARKDNPPRPADQSTEKAIPRDDPFPKTRPVQESRRDLLPDIEEINSTLRARGNRAPARDPEATSQLEVEEKSHTRRGFVLVVALVAACVLVYVFAPQIKAQVPDVAGVLDQYVAIVDAGRLWLNAKIAAFPLWLEGEIADFQAWLDEAIARITG